MSKENYASNSQTFVEYCVPLKKSKDLVLKKTAIILGAIIFFFATVYWVYKFLFVAFPLYFFLIGAMIWYFWQFVSIEYEYTIISGDFEMDIIYAKKRRKNVFTAKISEMELVAPVEEKYAHEIENKELEKKYFCASSYDSPDLYFAKFKNKDGLISIVFFDATKKTVNALSYYNRNAVVKSEDLTF